MWWKFFTPWKRVVVAGCLPGTCHYIRGNTLAKHRIDHVTELLKTIGLEQQRARMINVSAAMGAQLAAEFTNFVDTIKTLGPSPLSGETSNTRAGSQS